MSFTNPNEALGGVFKPNMRDVILKFESKALTGEDLVTISDKIGISTREVKVMLYDDLKGKTVKELFADGINRIYILLQIKDNTHRQSSIGHWILFMKQNLKGDKYVWYDPYGIKIGQELHITHEPDIILNITKDLNLDVNNRKNQEFRENVNTCGAHCVLRAKYIDYSNDEYADNIIDLPVKDRLVKNGDTIVALVTGLLT